LDHRNFREIIIERYLQGLNHSSKLSVDNIPREQPQQVYHRRSEPAFVPPELTEGTSDEWLRHLTSAVGSAGRRATTRSSLCSPPRPADFSRTAEESALEQEATDARLELVSSDDSQALADASAKMLAESHHATLQRLAANGQLAFRL
jgi:hypothetical protein